MATGPISTPPIDMDQVAIDFAVQMLPQWLSEAKPNGPSINWESFKDEETEEEEQAEGGYSPPPPLKT